ncbi:hypothetical protein PF005_g19360 [Phytophthora fragariae]|uniref:BED-type domain-containing protein n=1 Tax=Phytophthora fragariae TaxID=53985 RepID=A0A6A3SK16_9STRA|nr:hypothetical protein PF009_g20985 [Phytophthora fragariae]KAE8999723.1 hypothetical protein PF011_g14503 [Phytophthora fragariae]KAE9089386.1 hypothetical protein PF007_g19615 [Phytophthora fragariae]KAE9116637.1 hypothetical protein PF006_g18986 [Phytophthora fragariae]KAE9190160.1 hypothetical protein PF005_g19360 [Phytophthora fragariae]
MIVIDPSTLPASPSSRSDLRRQPYAQASPPSTDLELFRMTTPPEVEPSQHAKQRGRCKDPAWKEVIVADGIVSCRKCEKIIHHMGETHVERVCHHLQQKYSKRLKTPVITSCFPRALSENKISEFQKLFALWFYSTGMAFHKVDHPTLTRALAVLTPAAVVPTRYQLTTPLLNGCF